MDRFLEWISVAVLQLKSKKQGIYSILKMSMKIVYLLLQLQYLQHPIKKPAPNGAGLKQKKHKNSTVRI